MCRELPIVQLMRGPVHDGRMHPVLYVQHLADGLSIHALKPLKERPGKALQDAEGMTLACSRRPCNQVLSGNAYMSVFGICSKVSNLHTGVWRLLWCMKYNIGFSLMSQISRAKTFLAAASLMTVGGSCRWSPAKTARGARSSALQEAASSACARPEHTSLMLHLVGIRP